MTMALGSSFGFDVLYDFPCLDAEDERNIGCEQDGVIPYPDRGRTRIIEGGPGPLDISAADLKGLGPFAVDRFGGHRPPYFGS
jgi:hypothetical protein